MENKVGNGRNNYIDYMRGWAIFLMMWSHSLLYMVPKDIDPFELPLMKFIVSFNMPLFMMISGYLFGLALKKRDRKEIPNYIGRRVLSLSQALFFGSLIIFCIGGNLYEIIYAAVTGTSRIRCFTKLFSEASSIIGNALLWFLWSILAVSIAIAIVFYLCRNKITKCLLIFLLVPFVLAFPNGELNAFMYPYFVAAVVYANMKEKINPIIIKIIELICCGLFLVMIFFYNSEHYIYTTGLLSPDNSVAESLKIDAFRCVIGFVGSIFALCVGRLLWNIFYNKTKSESKLVSIGKNSLQYYVLSVALLSCLLPEIMRVVYRNFPILLDLFADYQLLYNFVITPVVTIIYLVIIHLVLVFLDKVKISKLFFGR